MEHSVEAADFFLAGFIKLLNLNHDAIDAYNRLLSCIDNVEDRELLLQCKKSIDRHIYKINMLYKKYLPYEILAKNSKEQLYSNYAIHEQFMPMATRSSFVEDELNRNFF